MAPVNPNRVYEEYYPPSDLVTEDGCDTILIYLPGFKKEHLKVQLTTSRILKVSGERQIDGNKWRRFSKEFRVPDNCDAKDITAKFEGGILYIRQPKKITLAAPDADEQPADKGKTFAAMPQPQQQAPVLPQRQPQQQAPVLPQHQHQPQQQAPVLPQHQPQQQAPVLPQHQPQQQASVLPQRQPQQQAPDLPQRLPQQAPELPQHLSQQAPELPQHLPQQAQALPQPQPRPQLQAEATLPEPQRGLEEKTRRKDSYKDAVRKEKDDEGKDKCEFKARPTRVGGRGGLYRELSKPDNFKRLVVSVLLVLGIGFYVTYMFKSFLGDSGYD